MHDWYIYLIRCNDNSLYAGITTDVKRRYQEHLGSGNKGSKYLRGRQPLKIVFKKRIGSRSKATKLEMKVKKLSKTLKEKLIKNPISLERLID